MAGLGALCVIEKDKWVSETRLWSEIKVRGHPHYWRVRSTLTAADHAPALRNPTHHTHTHIYIHT
jgi:hypothetical protein